MTTADWLVPLFFLVALPTLVVAWTAGLRGIRPALALVRRRFQVYTSYPFAVFATLAHGLVLSLVLIALAIYVFPEFHGLETSASDADVITFLTVGLIAWPAIWEAYELTHRNIRAEQTTGIFETLLATPVGVRILPLAYLFMTIPVALVVATVAYFLFTHFGGVALPIDGWVQALNVVTVLTTGLFMTWGLGLFLGGLTTMYKEIGPVGGLLKMIMLVFSNVYIQIGLFPQWVQAASNFLPLTWAFASIREVFAGEPISQDLGLYLVFLGYTVALIIAGLAVFGRSIERARQDGTTAGY